MKRHEILAAIAAAAGLTLATTAQAGLPSSLKQSLPVVNSMVALQAQVGQDSDLALTQMIHLAKASGGKSSKSEKSSSGGKSAKSERGSKAQGYSKSGNPKASGGPRNPGKGNKHNPS